jgi:hypothetical protein
MLVEKEKKQKCHEWLEKKQFSSINSLLISV